MTNENPEDSNPGGQAPVRVDIVSDVVCPWCIIGFKQLQQAQTETEIPLVVFWHPFELNPTMPEEGQDLFKHITEKYGSTREESEKARERLTTLGAELGFTFDYADDKRMVNSFRAHQLIHWASGQDKQHATKMALFEAYFSNGQDINDIDTLTTIAASIGLDPDDARTALTDGHLTEHVRQHLAFWTERGVTGVPTMVFNGRQALIGAQGTENYVTALSGMTTS